MLQAPRHSCISMLLALDYVFVHISVYFLFSIFVSSLMFSQQNVTKMSKIVEVTFMLELDKIYYSKYKFEAVARL